MSVFTVDLPNQPGEPARLCEARPAPGNLAHRDFMAEHHDLRNLGCLAAAQQ